MTNQLWKPMRGLASRSPFVELEREMDDLFNRFFRGWPGRGIETPSLGWMPPIDVIDRKNDLVLRADLPGLEEKDLDVTVANGVLTIQGNRHHEKVDEGDDHYAMERWSGSFARSVALPQGVNPDKIGATFKNGVLELRIPKTAESKGHKVQIKAA